MGIEEVIEEVVERQAAVTSYTHFYHPLANSEDITRMTSVLHSTNSSLTDGAERLQEAYRIILVQAGRQIAVSYRNILLRQTARLQMGEEDVGEETRRVSASLGEILTSPEYVFLWPVYLPLRRGCTQCQVQS